MKFKCNKEKVANAVNIVQKAVANKSNLSLLEGILIEANNNLKLTGNDLEIGIEYNLDAEIIENGSIVVSSKIFGEIIRRLPEAELQIEVNEKYMVIIDCENCHYEIKGIPADGFPSIPQVEKQNSIKISKNTLRDMIRQTIFSVCIDDFRPILTGSLFEYENGNLNVVSLDGNRLAIRKKSIDFKTDDFSVVIPAKTLNEILKILQPDDDEIAIYCSRNQIMFENDEYRIVSKLLEGEFFNYRFLMDTNYETKVRVNTNKFLDSIERAYIISNEDKEKNYPVKLHICKDKMVITSDASNGSVKDEISIDMWGKDKDIGYNPKYLIDALKVIEDEEICIYFKSSPGPCTIKPLEGDNFAYIIMSLRV